MADSILPRVVLLKPGSLIRDEDGAILDARSSVVLIISDSNKIIVDTGLVDEGALIIERLALQGLKPQDVDVVVNTHSHPDHCGNNHLFTKAKILSKEVLGNVKEGDHISRGVWILETPGHSRESISVVCESSPRIVIAGDALPILGNFLKWVPPTIHIDRELALSSMSRIVQLADVIVPGHDQPFSVSDKKYIFYLG